MTVTDDQNTKIITLSKAFDSRAKILNIVYFIVFTGFARYATIMLRLMDADYTSPRALFGIVMLVLIAAVYLFAAYKFLDKALQTETLTISAGKINLSKGGFSKKSNDYDINLISSFWHLDKAALTNHPLAGQSFDYLGFQTQQQVIDEMHGDNRLAFNYKGSVVTFGENIYSWEFDEIAMLLNDAAGRNVTAVKGEEKKEY
jgi:hypothetical protein